MKEKQKYKKMNQIIKSRIEEINRGKIPEGYKKTSVGIVPIEWTEHTLGDIFKFKNGINKEKEAFGQGTPIVNYTDVWKKRGLKAEDIKGRVVLSKNEIQNYEVKCGDVFFTRTSEKIEEIGYSSVLLDDIENAIFSGFVLRARPYNNLVSREYHQYCYSEPQMRHEIIKRSSMTTRALTSGPMLSQVAINLPSHREQSKIAEILMKWDEAIELQEQYIDILEIRKRYLMKKLLTPKDNWEYVLLGNICDIKTGRLDANEMEEDGIYPFFTCSKEVYRINQYSFDCEALLMAGNGDIGDVKYYNGKFDAYQRTYVLSNFSFNIKYVMQYLLLNFDRDVMKGMQKSSMPYIKLDLLKNAKIYYDPSMVEKTVTILSTVDNEIEQHNIKLEQLKKQRKTLQQYLLNGIVRVK